MDRAEVVHVVDDWDAAVVAASDAEDWCSCLAISGLEERSAVLLDPLVGDADGEWQCWDFYTHDTPTGYPSFAAYLAEQRRLALDTVAQHEHPDAEDLDVADDGTVDRWLRQHGVAPSWFWRLFEAPDPPSRLLDALRPIGDAQLPQAAPRGEAPGRAGAGPRPPDVDRVRAARSAPDVRAGCRTREPASSAQERWGGPQGGL